MPDDLDPSTHTLAFIDKYGSDLHPALDPEQKVLKERFRQTSDSTIEALDTRLYTEEFKKVIKAYAKDQGSPKLQALINHQDEHGWKETSWTEVLESFRKAEAKYSDIDKQRLRHMGHNMNKHAPSFFPLVRMVPNDMAFAVLSGGIRLIAEAAVRLNKTREDVLSSVIRIPQVIMKADAYIETFSGDAFVIAQAEILYVRALIALQGTMEWLCSGPKRKPFIAVLCGPLFNQKFDDKIMQLDQGLETLEMYVEGARDRMISRVDTGVGDLQQSMTDFSASSSQIQDQMHDKIQNMSGTLDTLAVDKENKEAEEQKRLNEDSKQAIEHLRKMLGETNSTAKWMQQRDRDWKNLKKRVFELERAGVALTVDDVLEIVNVGRMNSVKDLRKVLNAIPDGPESLHALNVGQDPVFQEWKNDDRSAALFLEQMHGSLTSRYISAMSVLTSNLVDSLQYSSPATCIHFFCGLHTTAGDNLEGPSGVIRGLLEQILRLFPAKLDFFSLRLKQQLEQLNFRALCECFSRIIRGLPLSTTLFCIVDSVNFLDKSAWVNDLEQLLEVFLNLTEDDNMSALFKVLVTSPVRTRHAREVFPSENRLIVNGENGSRGGLTERQLAGVRRRPRRTPQRTLRAALQDEMVEEEEIDQDWG